MPTYEYECLACKKHFERFQKFTDPPVSECPECGGSVRKVLFPAGVVFKGSGWYITDSRSTPSESSANGSGAASSDSKTETKAEAKTESKADSKAESKAESTPASSSTKSESGSATKA